jgi:hypothetical protein
MGSYKRCQLATTYFQKNDGSAHASQSAADVLIESNVTSFRDHYSFVTPSTESLYRLVHG